MKSCKFEGSIFFKLYKFFNYLPNPGSASYACFVQKCDEYKNVLFWGDGRYFIYFLKTIWSGN